MSLPRIRSGLPPWSPTSDASDVEVLVFHDMPLVGVFTSQGSSHIFVCLEGELDDINLWLFGPIGLEAAAGLIADQYADPATPTRAALSALGANPFVLALAVDGVVTVWNDYPAGSLPGDSVRHFLSMVPQLEAQHSRISQIISVQDTILSRAAEIIDQPTEAWAPNVATVIEQVREHVLH